jgi:hypothetical protein
MLKKNVVSYNGSMTTKFSFIKIRETFMIIGFV